MRHAIPSALASAALLVAPMSVLGASPVDGGAIQIYPVVINDGAGDQYDPHVSGDHVSYTAPDGIRLYSFATGADLVLPTGGVDGANQLSDVSGGLVVFAQLDSDFHVSVRIYDIASGILGFATPAQGGQQSLPAVGGSTIALIDTDITPTGELIAARLGGPVSRVTSDSRYDQTPEVDSTGSLIVWESCETNQANCDVRQASWDGASWSVTQLTNDGEPDSNPATDGSIVVYDSMRGGERDIHWQPVGGGAEQTLELPGDQRNPNVSSGLISFESIAPGASAAELYLYQVATNRLFRVTTTPWGETLNDVDVLGDGRVRLVWTTPGNADRYDRDVLGATIELPPAGPTYQFGGFASPVDALPTTNLLKAGAAVPVKFSLGGDQGLAIFETGYPKSTSIGCDATAPVDGVEETVTAGGSSLAYDPATGLYAYVWKTERAWAGTCRQLVLKFADGSFARANFTFR